MKTQERQYVNTRIANIYHDTLWNSRFACAINGDSKENRRNCLMNKDQYQRIINDAGSVVETYERNGRLHRDKGPAWITRFVNGTVMKCYYRDGKPRDPDDGPALVMHHPDGTVYEEYIRNNEKGVEIALSAILRGASGTVIEQYSDDKGPSRIGTAERAQFRSARLTL